MDRDSHTSVALARILWRERYGVDLETTPLIDEPNLGATEAALLIGDKVVSGARTDPPVRVDLGSAWTELTNLPFVFAAWAAPRHADIDGLADRLSRSRDMGVREAALIARDDGPQHGWPIDLAERYLTRHLQYKLGPSHRDGMTKFLALAKQYDIVPDLGELAFA